MVTYAIHANSFFLSGGPTGPGYLTVTDGVFGAFSTDAPSSVERIDERDLVAPGLVDTHIHGFDGHDVMDLSADGLDAMAAGLVRNGCTSFFPTPLTAPTERPEPRLQGQPRPPRARALDGLRRRLGLQDRPRPRERRRRRVRGQGHGHGRRGRPGSL